MLSLAVGAGFCRRELRPIQHDRYRLTPDVVTRKTERRPGRQEDRRAAEPAQPCKSAPGTAVQAQQPRRPSADQQPAWLALWRFRAARAAPVRRPMLDTHQPAHAQPGQLQHPRKAHRHLLVGRRLSPQGARPAQPLPARHARQRADGDGSAAVRRAVAHRPHRRLRRLDRGAVGLSLARDQAPGWPASAAAWRATAST